MNVVHEEKFVCDGKDYTIRIVDKGGEFLARGFFNNRPVSHMYSVEKSTRLSFMDSFNHDPFIDLIKSVKEDIGGDTGQKYLTV